MGAIGEKISKETIREKVISTIDMTREPQEKELHEIIDRIMEEELKEKYLTIKERIKIHKEVFNSIKGLGILEDLLEMDEVTEIMINGRNHIFIEKAGRIIPYDDSIESEERLQDIIQQIVAKTNRRVNESNPIVDTRLEDGSRVNVVLPPVALDGAVITIRKFAKEKITINQLIKWGTLTREVSDLLEKLVVAGYNIFVSGGTGSGKTTFLNVLSNFIPNDQRVVTIEDSAELQLKSVDNIVRLEARQANSQGENEITIRDLIKTSLRMRPDRIIVGEVRGAEALDMVQSLNTGHDGSMSTGHGNSPKDMLARLETMVLMGADIPLNAIRSQLAAGIDIMVHLARMPDKTRKVIEINEIQEFKDNHIILNKLYCMENGKLKKVGTLKNIFKLQSYGLSV
ncbi:MULTISPECIES: CpaF family protein [Eubacterium]|uniref:CpaF family protein n=1 Tax=Eubacterium TaxID=1730 RepID=UPI0026D493C8